MLIDFAGLPRDGPLLDYWQPLLGDRGRSAPTSPACRNGAASGSGRVRAAFLAGAPDGPRSLTATAWAARGRVP